MTPNRYNAVWISDLHLGFKDSKTDFLLEFLDTMRCDTLYLVGDVMDFWQMARRPQWRDGHTRVLQALLAKAASGTRVIYVPGNHDDPVRQYAGLSFGGVEVRKEAEHVSADGRRFLIIHGDQFDALIQCRLPYWLSSSLYDFLLLINRSLNGLRRWVGLPYWSLATHLKQRIPAALAHIEKFERAAVHEARHRHFHGVICGHIHRAEITEIDGLTYCNTGDWIENCTAMVEHPDGRFEIVHGAEEIRVLKGEARRRAPPRPVGEVA